MGLLNHKIIVYCEINNTKYEQVRIVAVDPKLDWAGDRKGGGVKGRGFGMVSKRTDYRG